MQNFLSLWLNAGAQITHGGQVQRPRQNLLYILSISSNVILEAPTDFSGPLYGLRWNIPASPHNVVSTSHV